MDNEFTLLNEDDVPGAKLLKKPSDCNMVELKRWLECHGLKKTGKKAVLVERVQNSLGVVKVDPKVDNGIWYDRKKDKNKDISNLENIGDPPLVSANVENSWKAFPSINIPPMFNYGHVYFYVVESVSRMQLPSDENSGDENFTVTDSVTAKPLRKGRSLLDSGFVEDVQDSITDEGDYTLRGHVHHSMKNMQPLCVVIVISSASGNIKKAECTCKASSLNRCAHITALLLFLSDHIKTHGSEVTCPATSMPCKWNKGKKRQKTPKPVQKATYKSEKRKASNLHLFDPRPVEYRGNIDDELTKNFIATMRNFGSIHNETPMWLTLLKFNYQDFELDLEDCLYYQELRNQFISNITQNLELLNPTEYKFQIPGTELQRDSIAWHQERMSRITASICKRVASLGEKLDLQQCFTWLSSQYWFKKDYISLHMQYGIDEEQNALSAFSKLAHLEVHESGLWVNKKYPHLGASPDGLIFDPSTGELTDIIEIKCLKGLENQTYTDWIKSGIPKSACVKLDGGKLVLKKTHSYFYQIQLQLLITEASCCYFILHSKVGEPYVQRVTRDSDVQRYIAENTYKFWYDVLIPEYFLRRVPRDLLPVFIDNGKQ